MLFESDFARSRSTTSERRVERGQEQSGYEDENEEKRECCLHQRDGPIAYSVEHAGAAFGALLTDALGSGSAFGVAPSAHGGS